MTGWSKGYAFILSFLAPLWTICQSILSFNYGLLIGCFNLGSFDSSVHISEEASNAASAVPWAIVNAVAVGGILGFGMSPF